MVPLQAQPGQVPFATVRPGGEAVRGLLLLRRGRDHGELELEGGGLLVRGVLELRQLHFYPTRLLPMGGFLVAGQGAWLRLGEVRASTHMDVELHEPPHGLELARPARAQVRCEDLSVTFHRLPDARQHLGLPPRREEQTMPALAALSAPRGKDAGAGKGAKDRKEEEQAYLPAGRRVSLALLPGGEEVAAYRFDHEQDAEPLAVEGAYTRVVVDHYSALSYGWVPSAALARKRPEGTQP